MKERVIVKPEAEKIWIYWHPEKYFFEDNVLEDIIKDGMLYRDISVADIIDPEKGIVCLVYNPTVSDQNRANKVAGRIVGSLKDRFE